MTVSAGMTRKEPGLGQFCCTPKGVKVKAAAKYRVGRGTVSVS